MTGDNGTGPVTTWRRVPRSAFDRCAGAGAHVVLPRLADLEATVAQRVRATPWLALAVIALEVAGSGVLLRA